MIGGTEHETHTSSAHAPLLLLLLVYADAPGGGLEMRYGNAQWWIEAPELQTLLIDLSGWPGYPDNSTD